MDAERFYLFRTEKGSYPGLVGGQRLGIHPVSGQVYPAALIGAIAPD